MKFMRSKNKLYKSILMTGNEAMGEASIRAGCRFYAGYPITPQNELTAYMAKRMREIGGVFIQAESELAAINMVFGASCAGARAMTSSSSPGISLKQEGLSYLAGCELPCLVINVMRAGPGLGNITSSQSDYFQATKGGGHGDYRLIVLAPWSVQEAIDLIFLGFELSERYRNPALILADAVLGQMMEPAVLPPFVKAEDLPKKDWVLDGAKDRNPRVIRSLFLKEGVLEEHNNHLRRKYEEVKKREQRFQGYKLKDARYLLVGFGSQARILREATDVLRREGLKVGLLRPITLWPFPEKVFRRVGKNIKKVLVVEQNFGQMVEDVKLSLPEKEIHFLGRAGGGIPAIREVVRKAKAIFKKR